MPYDRGLWRLDKTGGSEFSHERIPIEHTSSESEITLINCPICGKEQSSSRNSCISCNYNFNNRNLNLEKLYYLFVDNGWEIPLKKLQSFFKNNFYNSPYKVLNLMDLNEKSLNLIESKSKNGKVLFISNNQSNINYLKEKLENDENNSSLKFYINSENLQQIIDLINKFKSINQSLTKYSLKSFTNIESAKNLDDLKYLGENIQFIKKEDIDVLNEFIKVYWKFQEASYLLDDNQNYESINLEEDIANRTRELTNLKKSIIWFDNNLNRLTELYDLNGINYNGIDDKINFMDIFTILEKDPYPINSHDKQNFINLLSEYQKLNYEKISISDLLKNFFENNSVLLDILDNFKRYCNNKKDILNLNQNMLILKNKLKSVGIYDDNLELYYNLRDNLNSFSNYIYFDKQEYYVLNEKLIEFKQSNENFDECFSKNIRKLEDYLEKILNQNKDSITTYQNISDNIARIIEIFSILGINIDNFKDLKNNKEELNILLSQSNELEFYDYSNLIEILTEFDLKFESKYTLGEIFTINFNKLKNHLFNFFNDFNKESYKNNELEYIEYNFENIKQFMVKLGLYERSLVKLQENISKLTSLLNYSFNENEELINFEEFKKMLETGFCSEKTKMYLEKNSKSQILDDFNMMNVSITSLLYEINKNSNYNYLDDLTFDFDFDKNYFDVSEFDVVKSKILNLIEIQDIENFKDNYLELSNYIELIEKYNFKSYKSNFDELKEDFDYIYDIYSKLSNFDKFTSVYKTQEFLGNLKDKQKNNLKLKGLYEQDIFTQKTSKLSYAELKFFKSKLEELIYSVDTDYLKYGFQNDNFNELLSECNNFIIETKKENESIEDIITKIDNISSVTVNQDYSFIKNNPIFKSLDEKDKIFNEFKLMEDIKSLIFQLNIPNIKYPLNTTDMPFFNRFIDYFNWCKNFTEYVDKNMIDKSLFVNFSKNINYIDSEISSIKKLISTLNLENSILDDLSIDTNNNVIKINEKVEKIDEHMNLEFYDITKRFDNLQNIINMIYDLCSMYPQESKFGENDNQIEYNEYVLKLKNSFKNYASLLELENKILNEKEIINRNLENCWEGLFSDINKIINKLDIDEEFTKLIDKEIFEYAPLKKGLLSNDDFKFVNNFKNTLSDEKTKSQYLMLYDNKEILLNEINELNKIELNDYGLYLKTFKNINEILHIPKLENIVSLLELDLDKTENKLGLDDYLEQLNKYGEINSTYFNQTEFNLSFEEILEKLNGHVKFTQLINSDIVKINYLDLIKEDFDNFTQNVDRLIKWRNEIIEKLDEYIEMYPESNIDLTTDFNQIKNMKTNFKDINIFLADLNFVKTLKDEKYLSYFDYIICEGEMNIEDKFHLFLLSKNKLSIILMDGA